MSKKNTPQNKKSLRAFTKQSQFNRKSTATAAQLHKLVNLLRLRDGWSTFELRRRGICHPAGRVQNLRDIGFNIDTDLGICVDDEGFVHERVAFYSLQGEPEGVK